MPKTRPAYAPEYRRRIIELALAGRSPEDLAKEFEPSAPTIRTWVNQHRTDAGERSGLTREKEELAALRRENRQLREEREILRKATVFFVRETSR